MKKTSHIILGIIIGFVTAIALPVAAEEIQSIVGKQIQGEYGVTLNGNPLETKAGVIDGTSYLPVRAISEALGLDVDFDDVTGIILKTKGELEVIPNNAEDDKLPPLDIIEQEVSILSSMIKGGEDNLKRLETLYPNDPSIGAAKKFIKENKEKLLRFEKYMDIYENSGVPIKVFQYRTQETSYENMSSVVYKSETYFSLREFDEAYRLAYNMNTQHSNGIGYLSTGGLVFYKDNSEVMKVPAPINKSRPGYLLLLENGEIYINNKFFPNELKAK